MSMSGEYRPRLSKGEKRVVTFPDGAWVTFAQEGVMCTCGQSRSYVPDFGALHVRWMPCKHITEALMDLVRTHKEEQDGTEPTD